MIVPRLGPEAFKTYQIVAPLSTHFRPATCREVECGGYMRGWKTTVLPNSPQAAYIRRSSGRRFTEAPNESGDGTVVFTFPPGQQCFRASEHRKSLEREPLYVVRGGDFRGDPRRETPHRMRADDWVDDFAEHQQGLADRIEQG
jgi:hypothetical protein